MKLSHLTILTIALGFSSQVMAADWTDYLKGMQDSCDISDISQAKSDIPKNLQSSIIKYTTKNSIHYGDDATVDIRLKNATAFGQPIHRIKFDSGDDTVFLSVYFSNTDFKKVKPQFVLKNASNQTFRVGKEKRGWLVLKVNPLLKPLIGVVILMIILTNNIDLKKQIPIMMLSFILMKMAGDFWGQPMAVA